jgi:hypothetical protein
MNALDKTPYQTITANARKLHDLATWYAETSAAEHITHGQSQNAGHKANAIMFGDLASQLEKMGTNLDDYLAARRGEEAAPSIEKAAR